MSAYVRVVPGPPDATEAHFTNYTDDGSHLIFKCMNTHNKPHLWRPESIPPLLNVGEVVYCAMSRACIRREANIQDVFENLDAGISKAVPIIHVDISPETFSLLALYTSENPIGGFAINNIKSKDPLEIENAIDSVKFLECLGKTEIVRQPVDALEREQLKNILKFMYTHLIPSFVAGCPNREYFTSRNIPILNPVDPKLLSRHDSNPVGRNTDPEHINYVNRRAKDAHIIRDFIRAAVKLDVPDAVNIATRATGLLLKNLDVIDMRTVLNTPDDRSIYEKCEQVVARKKFLGVDDDGERGTIKAYLEEQKSKGINLYEIIDKNLSSPPEDPKFKFEEYPNVVASSTSQIPALMNSSDEED